MPLCPWDFPDKNTGVGCYFFLQGIFPTQWLNLCFLHYKCILYCRSHREATQLWRNSKWSFTSFPPLTVFATLGNEHEISDNGKENRSLGDQELEGLCFVCFPDTGLCHFKPITFLLWVTDFSFFSSYLLFYHPGYLSLPLSFPLFFNTCVENLSW